jgi:hypothetical protein
MPGSRPVTHQLTMTNTQGDPQAAQLLKMLHIFKQLVYQDQNWTIHDTAEEMGNGYGTCQQVLMIELGMHRVTAKFVPRIPTADQKQQRVVCPELCQSPPTMKPSCPGSSLVMRAEFMVMNHRQSNDDTPSGKAPRHQGQKRQERWRAMSRAWSSLSLTPRGLC